MDNRTYERFTKAATHSKDYAYYANSNRLLTDGHYAFVYDDDGNLIKKGNRFTLAGEIVSFVTEGKGVEYWEYTYNLRNQLSQVRKNGQLVTTYSYSGSGFPPPRPSRARPPATRRLPPAITSSTSRIG